MSNPNFDTRYTTSGQVDSKIAAQAATDAGQYAQQWKANAAYIAGQIVIAPDGSTVSATTGFTSSTTYSASNWTVLSPTASSIAATYATQTSVTSATKVSLAGTGGLVSVASGAATGVGTTNIGSDTYRSFITPHYFTTSCSFIILEFSNWYPSATSSIDTDGPTAVALRIGYDPNGPTSGSGILPVKFNGVDTVTIQPGGTVRSDPIYVDGTAGTKFWLRETMTPASGNTYIWNICADVNAGYAYSPVQDNARSGTNYAGGPVGAFGPTRIIGVPNTSPKKMVALIGDSIVQGANDLSPYDQTTGGYTRGLVAQGVPFVKIPRGGEIAGDFAKILPSSRRLALIVGCTDAIVEYGTNDLAAGSTAATVQTALTVIYQRLLRMGVQRIYQTTITPRSTSTDNWLTLANQTVISGFGPSSAQTTLNAWIRSNGSGLCAGYIDVEAITSSAVGSGKWLIRSVTDGAITSGSKTFTSSAASFTAADQYGTIQIAGAGASGATLSTNITAYVNATTVTINTAASTTVSAAQSYIDQPTIDGVHPTITMHTRIANALPNFTS